MQPTGSRPVIANPFFLPPTTQPVAPIATVPEAQPTLPTTNPKYAPPPVVGSAPPPSIVQPPPQQPPPTGVTPIQHPFQNLSLGNNPPAGIISQPFSISSNIQTPVNTNELFQPASTTIPKYAPPPLAGSAPPPQENRPDPTQGAYQGQQGAYPGQQPQGAYPGQSYPTAAGGYSAAAAGQQQGVGYPGQQYQQGQLPPQGYPAAGQQQGYPAAAAGGYPGQQYQQGYPGQQPILSQEDKVLKFPSPGEIMNNLVGGDVVKFHTKLGTLPPPAASKHICVDEGNCSPRFIRSSIYTIPTTADIAKKAGLPFGLVIQPLAEVGQGENEVPIVDVGLDGPIRCTRCRGYINSLNKFVDGGRKFICFLCSHVNQVPDTYFSPILANGLRHDIYERPELAKGSVEYKVAGEYITRPLQEISYLFVLELSKNSFEQGVIDAFIQSLQAILNSFENEKDKALKIAILTYDKTIQFYNFNENQSKPQISILTDPEDPILPYHSVEGHLLVNFYKSKEIITQFFNLLPELYNSFENQASQYTDTPPGSTNSSGCQFGLVLKVGSLILEKTGGKMIVFQSSLPDANPGKLESRLKIEFMGTDREREYYKPQTSYYELVADEFVKKKISVDLFVFSNGYIDLASISPISIQTGGQIYYYPRFSLRRDRLKFHNELFRLLTRKHGYDAVMRLRTSTGIEINQHFGGFKLNFGTDLELSAIDSDKVFVITLKNDGKLDDESTAGIQLVLLYTTSEGERRLRVHTLQFQTSSQIPKIFSSVDLDSIVFLLSAHAIRDSKESALTKIRRVLFEEVIQIVYAFRFHCSKKSFQPSILVLPEGLKLLPLYIICLLKSPFLKNARVSVDFRVWSRLHLYSMSVAELSLFLYPRMFALHKLPDSAATLTPSGIVELPPWERLLKQTLTPEGVFLLDNGQRLLLWIGNNVDSEYFQQVFTIDPKSQEISFNLEDNPISSKINTIITTVQTEHTSYKQLSTIKQGTESELIFNQMMVEERVEDTMSHADVLSLIQKEVANKLGQPIN